MFRLHYSPDSASMAVRFLLEELGLPYSLTHVDRTRGDNRQPDYLARQPFGLVPALDTDQGTLFETAAILLWLADRHPEARLAPAPADPARGAFLTALFFTSTNLHVNLLHLFYGDRPAGEAAAAEVIARARARIATCLTVLETRAAEAPDWLAPGRATLLGYYLAMLLRWLGSFAEGDPRRVHLADYPALHRLCADLETRAAAQMVAADEGLGALPFTAP